MRLSFESDFISGRWRSGIPGILIILIGSHNIIIKGSRGCMAGGMELCGCSANYKLYNIQMGPPGCSFYEMFIPFSS